MLESEIGHWISFPSETGIRLRAAGSALAHELADIENPQASLLYRWVIRGNSKLLLTYDGRPGKMKFPPSGGEPQLFDLHNDPGEKVNIAEFHPLLVKQLSGLLTDWYPADQRNVNAGSAVSPSAKSKPRKRE